MRGLPGRKSYPRRAILRWLAAAPAAVAAGGAAFARPSEEEPGLDQPDEISEPDDAKEQREAAEALGEEARCLAESEESLSRGERRALMEKMKGLEGALEKLRAFEVADDVEPAIVFRPLGSGGGR